MLAKNYLYMKKKILMRKTLVVGPCFFGSPSSISFLPAGRPGWFLRTPNGDIPIDFKIVKAKKGRLQAKYGGIKLNVIEHIMALKLLIGLDQVILVPHNAWPPYIGGAGGYAKQLAKSWVQTNYDFASIKPTRDSVVQLNNKLATEVSITEPRTTDLSLTVHSHWSPLPPYQDTVTLGNLGIRQDILNARPQGYPIHREYFADLATMLGWPNKKYVSWIDKSKPLIETSYEWWAHAVQDCLGELALCHYQKIPTAKVFRWCAGHEQTLEAVKIAFS